MTEEIGLKQPVEYTEAERRTIATHEAGSRHRRLAGRQGPQARGAVDHQAQGRARPARPLRPRGALHQDRVRDRRAHPDRHGRHGGRGAVLRRGGHRPVGRPAGGHDGGRPDGRLARHGRLADLLRRDGGAPARRTSWPRCCRPTPARTRSTASSTTPRPRSSGCSTSTATSSRRCATRCSSATSSSRDEILDVIRRAELEALGMTLDLRAAPGF